MQSVACEALQPQRESEWSVRVLQASLASETEAEAAEGASAAARLAAALGFAEDGELDAEQRVVVTAALR